ncbi:terminase small subunit [Yoonia sp.]|uniref:terminase small subunit n=1 Tax=Yoonia sp. TaxID=2212373 RepID=UPI002DF98F75|nr:terminase small subunit [Yoonia sp.]
MGVLKNIKHEAFAQGIAKGLSADAAYKAAGYKPNRHNASRLNTNDNIVARVAELTAPAVEATQIEASRVLQELARVGTSDIRKLFGPNGGLLHVTDLDDATAAAVASVEVVTKHLTTEDQSGEREVEYVHKIKFWDKNSALDKLAKNLALYAQDQAAQQTADSISEFLEAIKGAQPTPVSTRETDD